MSASSALKVSVVVATYRSGDGLERLVASLDAQSLPSDEWEVIFVDDGSPDDTWERLQSIRSTRPHVRLERIENSGWPSRPRNVGIDLAAGEYIAFMDHDDELYPDALRDAYAFAKANGADVLNGKEARTSDIGWAIDVYQEDLPQVLDRTDAYPLSPTNPHKLYRREFLLEHDIRFREGGRVLWEDVFFNVLAGKHAKVISTLARTPYYHWCTTAGSGSTSFLRSNPEWWHWLDEMVTSIDDELSADGLEAQHRNLMTHQYRSRLIDTFNNRYAVRPPDEKRMIFERARKLQTERFPESYDASLNNSARLRAQLLRKGLPHLLERMTQDDPNIPGRPVITQARWDAGVLSLTAGCDWADNDGRQHRLIRQGDRLLKDLDPRYLEVVDAELLDMTDEIRAARLQLLVRSVDTKIAWTVPSTSETWIRPGSTSWGVRGTALVDPSIAALGAPLSGGVWEIGARCTMPGSTQHRLTRAQSLEPAIHIAADGRPSAVYAKPDGVVVLDQDQKARPLTHLVRAATTMTRTGNLCRVEVFGLPTGHDATISTHLDVDPRSLLTRAARIPRRLAQRVLRQKAGTPRPWRPLDATIVVEAGRAFLEFRSEPDQVLGIRIGERVPGNDSELVLRGSRLRRSSRIADRILG